MVRAFLRDAILDTAKTELAGQMRISFRLRLDRHQSVYPKRSASVGAMPHEET